jgi:hypothetical protein
MNTPPNRETIWPNVAITRSRMKRSAGISIA